MADRRQQVRVFFPKGNIFAHWTSTGLSSHLVSLNEIQGNLVNISWRGCGAILPQIPPTGTPVHLKISLGSPGPRIIETVFAEAQAVRYSAAVSNPGMWIVGFEFCREQPGVSESVDLAISMLDTLEHVGSEVAR